MALTNLLAETGNDNLRKHKETTHCKGLSKAVCLEERGRTKRIREGEREPGNAGLTN